MGDWLRDLEQLPDFDNLSESIKLPSTPMNGSDLTSWLFLGILILGGIVSLGLIPLAWFEALPGWVQIPLIAFMVLCSLAMFLGTILDSGILQRIFRKK